MTHPSSSTDFITPELLARYDKPGPRYTSYPTALEFTEDVTHRVYEQRLDALQHNNDPVSVYVHIPFCKSRCHFCGCHTALCREPYEMDEYVTHVCGEVSLLAGRLASKRSLAAIHFGGGTPAYLGIERLKKMFQYITDHFSLLETAEVSIEVNPGVTPPDQIRQLRDIGFNRISLGVQDFNDHVLKEIGRNQTREDTVQAIDAARDARFSSVNLDLIYGLPYQTVDTFSKTLSDVLAIRPDRVALYSFAFIPWIRENQGKLNPDALPGRDDKFAFFAMALRRFQENDYLQIGMDHFALRTDEMGQAASNGTLFRNFMGYTVTRSKNSIGLGVSSIGYVDGSYFQNEKENAVYYGRVSKGELPVQKGLILSNDDLIRAAVITEIMCNFRLDIAAFEARWQVSFSSYFKKELAELDAQRSDEFPFTTLDSHLRLTDAGKLFVRNVCMVFDTYLKTKSADRPLFSRTV
ncbi:MAG: oxygen-independent coproporphyrinogen III oxidase [Deltaproteobacteria bacterium]|nr:oxygen-independent coproporphyrinogen III oxidase [Deltaproteobacteria bacterium]MBN2672366.1 oxygen-independent coproporphyrinogen III oxidase [Deltaproteobacteria bacterium]